MCQIADWLTAFGTISLGVVAIFQEHLRRLMFKPKLDADASSHSPHCVFNTHLLVGTNSVERPHYSLRIAVENCGNTEAKNVEVFIKNLQRQKGHGDFELVTDFLATYLSWSGSEEKEKDVLRLLNPEMPKYCYLGRVFWKQHLPTSFYSDIGPPAEEYLGDRTVLDLPPAVGSGQRQRFGPGNYRLTVMIGAVNAKRIERTLNLSVTGRWPGVEPQRVSEVLDFGIVSS